MLLRRITTHVENQNWLAIAIDFLIVVVGVFIGLQASNWSDANAARQEYKSAIDRFDAEVLSNLEILKNIELLSVDRLSRVGEAFDILLSCEDSDENRAAVNGAILLISGTLGLSLRTNALSELTENDALLAQQSERERKRLGDLKYIFDLIIREAQYIETLPLNERFEDNPIIKIGDFRQGKLEVTGVDFSRQQRALELNVPIDEACQDNDLIKSFYYWERWQSVLPVLVGNLKNELSPLPVE